MITLYPTNEENFKNNGGKIYLDAYGLTTKEYIDKLYRHTEINSILFPNAVGVSIDAEINLVQQRNSTGGLLSVTPKEIAERTISRFENVDQYIPKKCFDFFLSTVVNADNYSIQSDNKKAFDKFVKEGGNVEAIRLILEQSLLAEMKLPQLVENQEKELTEKLNLGQISSWDYDKTISPMKSWLSRMDKNIESLKKFSVIASQIETPYDAIFNTAEEIVSAQKELSNTEDTFKNRGRRKELEKLIKDKTDKMKTNISKFDPKLVEIVAQERKEYLKVVDRQVAIQNNREYNENSTINDVKYSAATMVGSMALTLQVENTSSNNIDKK